MIDIKLTRTREINRNSHLLCDFSLLPFKSDFINIDGNLIHFIDEGHGPVLLMLHGNPTWSFVYRNFVKLLSKKFRCIVPDYPGFGLSVASSEYDFTPKQHASVIRDFIKKLNLKNITLLVHDWGGPIGFSVAGECPDRFASFIVMNTIAWPVSGDLHFEIFSKILGGPIGKFLIERFNVFVNILIPMGVKRRKLPPTVMEVYRAPFPTKKSRYPTYVFPRSITQSKEFLTSVESGIKTVSKMPSLIIWAGKDIAFRNKELLRFQNILKNSKTVILDDAGHFIQEDSPEEACQAIDEWWPIAHSG